MKKTIRFEGGTVLNKENLALVTDLTSGFSKAKAKKYGFDLVNFSVSYKNDGKVIEYKDGNEQSDEFYAELANEKTTDAKTGSSIEDFVSIFKDRLKEGKLVIYLGVTDSLSAGMRNAALTARQMICDDEPDLNASKNILIWPTHCIAGGLGLSLRLLRAWLDEKPRTLNELKEKVDFFGNHTAHIFTLFSYDYMKRSGRFASTKDQLKIALAKTMKIFPIMLSPRNGPLQPTWKKVRGERALLKAFIDIYADTAIDPEHGTVEIDYSGPTRIDSIAYKKAEELRKMLTENYPEVKVIMAQTSPSVGCHVGPDEISFFFLQKDVRPDME